MTKVARATEGPTEIQTERETERVTRGQSVRQSDCLDQLSSVGLQFMPSHYVPTQVPLCVPSGQAADISSAPTRCASASNATTSWRHYARHGVCRYSQLIALWLLWLRATL